MPRTPEQLDRIREESRERILASALALFARHGYAHTSVRMIAEDAGISQGLLYNYYDGKQALLHAIFERSMGEVREDLGAASRARSAEAAVSQLVTAACETVRSSPDFWRLSYQLRMQPEVLAGLGEQVGAWSEAIRSRMEQLLHDAGAPDARLRSRVLFAAIDGAAQHYVLDPERYPLDEVADEMIRLLVPQASASPPPRQEKTP